MSILLEKKCQDQIQEICISHTAFISQLIQSPSAKNVRQIGTILAFELVTNEGTSYFNPIRNQAYQYFMERGVLLRPLGNVIYIMPPYCITNDELTMVYGVIIEFLNSINS
jgi:adenosylmethionine-8-amino-7-oxononanoate aminotransferase